MQCSIKARTLYHESAYHEKEDRGSVLALLRTARVLDKRRSLGPDEPCYTQRREYNDGKYFRNTIVNTQH